MTNPTIQQIALRRAADAVAQSLDGALSIESTDASPAVREEYTRALARIAATLYRRVASG